MNFERSPAILKHPTTIGLALGATALLLRLALLGTFPPGLHHDEAWNGIDALTISPAFHPIFFPNSNGREPLFLYLQALSMGLFGQTPAVLRAVSAVAGAATVVVTFYLARALTQNLAVGALAGILTACSFWHLLDSRLGYRAILQPLCMSAAILVLWMAWHTDNKRVEDKDTAARWSSRRFLLLGLGGAFIGMSAYTYIAARVFPGVLALWFCWRVGAAVVRKRVVREVAEWLAVAAISLLIVSPLAYYFWRHPDDFFGRSSQVSVFAPASTGYDAATGPWSSTVRTLGMFTFKGDPLWKFNIGSKPVFDWPLGLLFYGGLGMAAWAFMRGMAGGKRRAVSGGTPVLSGEAGWLLLVWIAVMLVPGFLSTESPYYYRTIGIIPAIFIVPACALIAVVHVAPRVTRHPAMRLNLRRVLVTLGGLLILFEVVSASVNYFVIWAPSQPAYYDLHGEAADMARALSNLPAGERVVIATDYYQHPTIRFLAPLQSRTATWIRGTEAFVVPPGSGMVEFALQGKVEPDFLNLDSVFKGYAPVALGKDFAHDEAYRIYRAPANAVTLPSPATGLNFDLGGMVHVVGCTILGPSLQTPNKIGILLFWTPHQASTRRISIFTHLEDASGHLWAQRDNIGYFSPDWIPGARVVTYHEIEIPPGTPPVDMQLRAGFYYLDDLSPLAGANGPFEQQHQGMLLGKVTLHAIPDNASADNSTSAHPSRPLGQSGIAFERTSPLPATVKQDGDLDVTLYMMRSDGALQLNQHIKLALVDASGNPVQCDDRVPLAAEYPPSHWVSGLNAENHRLHVGARAEPGPKNLVAMIVDQADKPVGPKESSVDVGTITITPLERSFSAPESAITSGYNLGGAITLDGLTLSTRAPQPGGQIDVSLTWKDVRPIDTRYTVFVHLVDASGKLRGQHDGPPSAGVWPTTTWIPGQFVVDRHSIPIDAGAPPGDYHLEIGLYDPSTGKRLPVTSPDGRPAGDYITIGDVRVGTPAP
jgi:hypothetical protein